MPFHLHKIDIWIQSLKYLINLIAVCFKLYGDLLAENVWVFVWTFKMIIFGIIRKSLLVANYWVGLEWGKILVLCKWVTWSYRPESQPFFITEKNWCEICTDVYVCRSPPNLLWRRGERDIHVRGNMTSVKYLRDVASSLCFTVGEILTCNKSNPKETHYIKLCYFTNHPFATII